jgi:hypothetical protein
VEVPAPQSWVPKVEEKKVKFENTAPVVKEPVSPAASGAEIERLKANWQKILEGGKTRAIAMMRSGKPVVIENEIVTLSFPSTILRDLVNKEENQSIAEKLISDFLGRSCKINCICETSNNHLTRSAIKLGAQIINVEEK